MTTLSTLPLQSITLSNLPQQDAFPFNVPSVRALSTLAFESPVTFFVGENGSGKSTLLEALAVAANAISAGSDETSRDATLTAARALAKHLKLTWSKKTNRGFFLRAEDFFGFVKRLSAIRRDMEAEIQRVDVEMTNASDYARGLAKMPYARELADLRQRYGADLDHYSHGESFLKFFSARLRPGGLHLLDEPEAPLSPTRQLTLLAMLKEMVGQGAQFIVATHSPILMAYPGAAIYSFDYTPARRVAYEDLEHVTLLRTFLNDPSQFLKRMG